MVTHLRFDVRATRTWKRWRCFVELVNLTNHSNVGGYDHYRTRDGAGNIGLARGDEKWVHDPAFDRRRVEQLTGLKNPRGRTVDPRVAAGFEAADRQRRAASIVIGGADSRVGSSQELLAPHLK